MTEKEQVLAMTAFGLFTVLIVIGWNVSTAFERGVSLGKSEELWSLRGLFD